MISSSILGTYQPGEFLFQYPCRSMAERSYPTSEVRGAAKRSYPTLEVRGGGQEELPHIQGKEQWPHFAETAVKRCPMSKVRETQVRRQALREGIRGQTH